MNFKKPFFNFEKALVRVPFLLRVILALLSGIGLSFIQAPYHLWFLIIPCLGLFYLLYSGAKNKKQTFITAYVFGLGYFITGLNWIGNALLVAGNDYQWVWPLAVIALPALLSLFTALYVTIAHIIFRKDNLSGFLGFCTLLMVSEWVRGYAFTGFPWNLYAYGWASYLPVAQVANIIGPYGLSFLTIFWGCAFGYLLSWANIVQKSIVLILLFLSVFSVELYGQNRLSKASDDVVPDVRINIVQPNIAQADKWKPELMAQNFEQLVRLSTLREPNMRNVIIWPETAIPPSFVDNRAVRERLYSLFNDVNTILLTGALDISQNSATNKPQYHNSLMLFDGGSESTRIYSKSHLVPFGEYIPFQKYIPLTPVVNFSGFNGGDGAQTIKVSNFPTFSPTICYEIIFPHTVVNPDQPRPDYILTVTNDAWYGDSPGPYQHFTQARFRAIEQGVPVVRVANTGISGIIDAHGRVGKENKIDLMESGSLTANLPLKTPTRTYYGMYGDKPFLGFLFLCLFGAIMFRNKQNY